jgi:protein-L-isoaspartate(D-aspartate) O-methyltransferase
MRFHKYLLLSLLAIVPLTAFSCQDEKERLAPTGAPSEETLRGTPANALRDRLIDKLQREGITDEKVLAAMRKTPRHEFVPEEFRNAAYDNRPVPIGFEQTISQPYIVGYMTQLLQLKGGEKVLEIGTGSGYQAAVLAEIAEEVYTIEIVEPLARRAEETLQRLGYDNVKVKLGDGYKGWPEHAPFDAIIVTAAPEHIPQPLVEQLKEGGRMVIPVGTFYQRIILVTKDSTGVTQQTNIPVRFVPMTGEAQVPIEK